MFFSTSKMEIAYFTTHQKNTKFSNVYIHQPNPQRNHFDFHCSALPLLFENTDSKDIFDLK